MNRFVILAVPRTGSNLLCTLLDSHPRILCHHEVFNPQGIFTALPYRNKPDNLSLADRDRDPLGFLHSLWRTGMGHACVGFKWTLGQPEVVLNHVALDKGIKKFVLRRRNRIKTYVSETIARQLQQWEVYSAADVILPRPRVQVNPQRLLAHVQRTERFYQRLGETLRQTQQPFIELDYENLADAAEHLRMLRFLGVDGPQDRLRPTSVKQNPTELRQLIANFDELAAALRDSDLYEELQDCEM